MEINGIYFYSTKTDTYYEFCEIEKDTNKNYTIRKCELKYVDTQIEAIDPENSKEYKYVEVYEKVPISKKYKLSYKKMIELLDNDENIITLELSDKYCYKDVI